jgi:hypothetical protein
LLAAGPTPARGQIQKLQIANSALMAYTPCGVETDSEFAGCPGFARPRTPEEQTDEHSISDDQL